MLVKLVFLHCGRRSRKGNGWMGGGGRGMDHLGGRAGSVFGGDWIGALTEIGRILKGEGDDMGRLYFFYLGIAQIDFFFF